MPGGFGDILRKAMGPTMAAGGAVAAPFTGGATIPIAMGGLSQMTGPGGVLAANPSMPAITPPKNLPAPAQENPNDLFPASPVSGGTSTFSPNSTGVSTSGASALGGDSSGGGMDMSSMRAAIQQAVMQAMGLPAMSAGF